MWSLTRMLPALLLNPSFIRLWPLNTYKYIYKLNTDGLCNDRDIALLGAMLNFGTLQSVKVADAISIEDVILRLVMLVDPWTGPTQSMGRTCPAILCHQKGLLKQVLHCLQCHSKNGTPLKGGHTFWATYLAWVYRQQLCFFISHISNPLNSCNSLLRSFQSNFKSWSSKTQLNNNKARIDN